MIPRVLFIAVFCASLALAAGEDRVAGTWRGELDGLPGITLTVHAQKGKLEGTVVFYLLKNEGAGPRVVGKTELPILDPSFDGDTLRFRVKHHDHGGSVSFEMRLTGDNEAVMKRLTENEGPNDLKMLRQR